MEPFLEGIDCDVLKEIPGDGQESGLAGKLSLQEEGLNRRFYYGQKR